MIHINTRKIVLIVIALLTTVALVGGIACAVPKTEARNKPVTDSASKPEAKAKTEPPTLKMEKKGSYVYWFTYEDAEGVAQSTLPARFKGKSTELDLAALGDKPTDAKLYVMSRSSGVMAITDYPQSEGSKDVHFRADDLQYVRSVRLRIVAEDKKPVESAIVRISDGMNTKMTAIVTPADEGVATFADVATGETTVKVEAEGLRKTLDSDINIEPGATPGYEQDIKVAGDVNTIAVKAKAKQSAAKPQSGGLSAMLSALAGFVVLILIIIIVLLVLRKKGVTGKAALEGLGVQLPGDADGAMGGAPAGQPTDPNVCQFCGQRKDASGQCACSVLPSAAAPAATGSSSAGPRLVGFQGVYSGHIFELTGGSTLMGRESDNPIALPNDSTASRRHATISQTNGGYSIRDEGSSNGTFVNGAKVTEQQLSAGDEIQIGGTKFRFEV